jgi:hypothetical protein
MTGFNSGITKSPITYSPSFQRAKHIIEEPSAAEYKTAASISTRNIGTLCFVVQIAETFRSIIQMRYASNPGQIQGVSTSHLRGSVLTSTQQISCKCGGKESSDPMTNPASEEIFNFGSGRLRKVVDRTNARRCEITSERTTTS